jgi:hypothetical protein
MPLPAAFGLLALAVTILSYVLYVRSARAGRSRPSRMTWALFTVLTTIAAASYWRVGATDTLPAAVVTAAGALAMALVSIRHGHGGWQPVDRLTLAGVILVGALWALTGNPLLALLAALTVDFLALVPTLAKLLHDPRSEEPFPWAVIVLASILNLLALDLTRVGDWTLGIAAYPVYMLAANLLTLALTLRSGPRTGL